MDGSPPKRNKTLEAAIQSSHFGSISRLAEHLGVHYRNVESYVILERDPIDRYGYVKYDVVAIAEALGASVEALFKDVLEGRAAKLDDGKHPGKYGPRAKKREAQKEFPERELSPDQAKAVIALLDIKALVSEEQALPLAETLIRRIQPEEYEVFTCIVFDGMGADDTAQALGINPRAVRSRYKNTLRFLNSPATLRVLKRV